MHRKHVIAFKLGCFCFADHLYIYQRYAYYLDLDFFYNKWGKITPVDLVHFWADKTLWWF